MQRKIDVVLDSVRRLIRLGATAFTVLLERNSKLAMEALSELGPEGGAALLADRSAEDIARLLHDLPSDDAAAIIDNLPEALSAAVLELIEKRPGDEVGELLEYDEQTAGRIMNPKVFALSEDMTAGEAITTLQGSRDVEMVFYLYVVDVRRHLVGVISLRRLLLVPPTTPLKRIMTTDLTSVRTDTDQEEVARLVASYNLLAIPVVDEENKLVGIITVDDVIDVIKDEATEDVYRLAGVAGDDRHEDRERADALDGALEQRNHRCRQEGGREVHSKPRQALAQRLPGSREHAIVAGDAGEPVDVLGRFVLDDVDDVVHRDHAGELVLLVHDRNGEEVVGRHLTRDFFLVGVDPRADQIGRHDPLQRRVRRDEQKTAQ